MDLNSFRQMIPTNKEASEWFSILSDLFPKYGITTPERIAAFMSQAAHESSDFTRLEENLKYSTKRLREVFPRYFPTEADAKKAGGNPELIANIVYNDANRTSKLGNTQVGDGWKFRGGGIFQLTGRYNYAAFGKSVGKTADEAATYVRTKKGAAESACWFWSTNGLNAAADSGSVEKVTKIINGGTNGLADRKSRYAKNIKLLDGATPTPAPTVSATSKSFKTIFRRGNNDPAQVKDIQTALKIGADGIFGLGTESAVRSWQRTNGFVADGNISETQYKKLTGK